MDMLVDWCVHQAKDPNCPGTYDLDCKALSKYWLFLIFEQESLCIFPYHKLSYFLWQGLDLIHENDTIMVYARSEVVENLLLTAHRKGKQFTVIVVDNTPYHEGK